MDDFPLTFHEQQYITDQLLRCARVWSAMASPEDVVQEVWLRCLPRIPYLDDRSLGGILAYCIAALRNYVYDQKASVRCRFIARMSPLQDDLLGNSRCSPVDVAILAEQIASLPTEKKEVFQLFAIGLSKSEIAERKGVSMRTVRNYVKVIREHLTDESS